MKNKMFKNAIKNHNSAPEVRLRRKIPENYSGIKIDPLKLNGPAMNKMIKLIVIPTDSGKELSVVNRSL